MCGMTLSDSVERSMLDGRDCPGVDMGVPDPSLLLLQNENKKTIVLT